jgi:hypothetical protein
MVGILYFLHDFTPAPTNADLEAIDRLEGPVHLVAQRS